LQAHFEIITVVYLTVPAVELGRFVSFEVDTTVAVWTCLLERDAMYFVPDILIEKLAFLFCYRKVLGSNP